VSLWGFFKDIDKAPTQTEIDSVLTFVGFENKKFYSYESGVLTKHDSRFKLVFNAIAKGQSVDVIADFLDKKRQESYFIEVGGEIRVKGMNDNGSKWVIGVDVPLESNTGTDGATHRKLENYIEVTNRAVATSGNYRDFYELDGRKYSHTLSPVTGKPVRHNILSATVVAQDAASADAYATAFMVMGVEKTLALIKSHPELGIDAYLLFDGGNDRIERAYSRGMLQYLMD
jgi:thiamine biosynthesis lipoprotein